jgi:hypothetical protein
VGRLHRLEIVRLDRGLLERVEIQRIIRSQILHNRRQGIDHDWGVASNALDYHIVRTGSEQVAEDNVFREQIVIFLGRRKRKDLDPGFVQAGQTQNFSFTLKYPGKERKVRPQQRPVQAHNRHLVNGVQTTQPPSDLQEPGVRIVTKAIHGESERRDFARVLQGNDRDADPRLEPGPEIFRQNDQPKATAQAFLKDSFGQECLR